MKSSNDKKELYYRPDQFIIDFLTLCDRIDDEEFKEWFFLLKDVLLEKKEQFFKECKVKSIPYAFCLSEKRDNLTHWDRYAAGCTGVCIGFNVAALDIHIRRSGAEVFGKYLYDINNVLYQQEKIEDHIKRSILRLMNVFGARQDEESLKASIKMSGYVTLAAVYLQAAAFVKHGAFFDEDEIRLFHDATSINVALRLIESIKPDIDIETYKYVNENFLDVVSDFRLNEEFYMTKSGIRSYRNLCLEKIWGPGTITEIILGPMCVQNKEELKRFLKANGLAGTKISISKVPIR